MKVNYLIICLFIFSSFQTVNGQSPDFTGLKVMINPGHGGNDSNDRGMPNGFWESEGNLTKGLWLRDLLEARGCDVIMSRVLNRTEDDLPLSIIAAMANDNNVDLFISIHSNAGNQTSNYPMPIFNGKSDDPAIPEAKEWARILWEQLITNQATFWTNTNPRYIGDLTLNPDFTYGYGVIYPLQVPGIISEGSFHDYKPEMDRLLSLDYRKQEAWNMLFAMETYFELPGTEPFGNISGIIRDSLLVKDNYSIANSPDKYLNVNGTLVEIQESGDQFLVDDFNTGFYMFDSIPAGSYHLIFSAPDYFNDTVAIEVSEHQFSFHNHWMTADKTMAPKIVSHIPGNGETTNCFDPVRITFNMNMDSATVAQAFQISPEIAGSFSWDKDYLNVYFQPNIPYNTNTEYSVSLNNTAEHQWGVSLDSALNFTFLTNDRNKYNLTKSFPSTAQESISPYLQFRLIFDAPLNNSSLIDAVEIIPVEGAPIGTKGASISTIDELGHYYFSPSEDLEFGKSYILRLKGSIQDEKNIPLVNTIDIPFTCMEEPQNLVIIDELDLNGGWAIDFANSSGIDGSSFLYRWTKTFRSGAASTLLRYNFLQAGSSCVLKPVSAPVGLIENSEEIALWIWGEMSNNTLSIVFDNESEASLCTINFAGWNYCKAQVPEGAKAVSYIKISHAEEGALTGDIYIDALNQRDLTGLTEKIENFGLTAYPNPLQGNILNLKNIPDGLSTYSIYSLTGKELQKGELDSREAIIELNSLVLQNATFMLRVTNPTVSKSILISNSNKQ